ncbi:hypothetical protein TOPH_08705 [Tolypocladium ophioglossoides CBS 100239]|uniref:Pre-mRNA splicing factor n=1 Tax=Tolypocladium ophioglossoides (strain CBS 100239) TaxID=1163406 RepID=A0A0L0MXR8_TOLOC|nr:hypothetical protein TOPH_08705 [Tolypocladium ophioglossoides CBS 100239]
MTRVSVYSAALVACVAATAMIVASIATPNWVSYSVTTAQGETFEKHIGLHKSCSNLDAPACRDFPYAELCQAGEERYFCSMWRTVGFMASLAAILCLAGLVGFAVILRGGKYKRETGWPFVGGMLSLVAVVEFVMISIVAYLFENDDQFTVPGWNLDFSWYLSTVSAALCLLAAAGLAVSAYLLPPEEGYEFLEDPLDA